ncbi:hypothetical protein K432DRAFT_332947 [Lepidopterella palustris CBS 459.81]|uniref:FZ domain-containing protein n=1 Tax=Lepidopterella palustris CBS 459.81 TaxID=1314670 RepID=A0A8E2E616_9PEZI|nr:hypothetical protein K432DRAFT_332947 [Lepidopterella palustris CBS 459.81]
MQFPKLTPLQSRLAASLIASAILVIVYLSLSPHHFAYAAELDSLLQEDHNHHRLEARLQTDLLEGLDLDDEDGPDGYEAEFLGISRSIIGRAAPGVDALTNNMVRLENIIPGSTHNYVFSKEQVMGKHSDPGVGLPSSLQRRNAGLNDHEAFLLELEEENETDEEESDTFGKKLQSRQGQQPTVYISVNTCQQPSPNGTVTSNPPQLTLYVSSTNPTPGPQSMGDLITPPITFDGGFANHSFATTGDVNIGIFAPPLPTNYTGIWNYELTASIDGFYHNYNGDTSFLYFVDSDSDSGLFVTHNLVDNNSTAELDQQWLELGTPFTMFAFGVNDTAIKGLENSFCGLRQQFTPSQLKVTAGMTTRGSGNKLKGQFYIQGLNASTSYYGFMAMIGNGTLEGINANNTGVVGGGGQIWQPLNFTTKSDGNCQVIFNLTFCNEVAYAVPSNPQKFNISGLSELYDSQAAAYYQNFSNSLAQIACNTTNTAQYSLARNCTDCARDYKNWLCAVQIPRCEDYSSPPEENWLLPRNIGAPFINGSVPVVNDTLYNSTRLAYKQSRNPLIDNVIKPGPYKEVLPCDDLCYSIVQSCPAKLQFQCPQGDNLAMSYGVRTSVPDQITCSYLGAVYYLNASSRSVRSVIAPVGTAVLVGLTVLLMG